MSPDEQAIRQLIQTWMSATQNGDTATVLGLMTEDVLFHVPGHAPFGKEAFAKASEGMKGVSFAGTNEIVELSIHGDWAWMRCRLRVEVTPPGAKPVVRSGYTMSILQKDAKGVWRISRDTNLLTVESEAALLN
ncbi:MAG: YybH family protein [Planctomycetaceae bacterium]